MVVGEGDKGIYVYGRSAFIILSYRYLRDTSGFINDKGNIRVTNTDFKQIVSGKLTQWEDYT